MKIVVFGHQNWGIEAIKALHKQKIHEIAHVFTHPLDMDPNEKVWYPSLKNECQKLGINVSEQNHINQNDIDMIRNFSPDLILSSGWRKLIPTSVIEIPKFGCINIHDGLLPNYRGFAPINWAIINGEKEIGLTAHFIDKDADTGDIISQIKISIDITETATDAYKKLLPYTENLILEAISKIQQNTMKGIPQNITDGFFCCRRFPDDGKIDWSKDRITIYNLIRALSDPYPNAFCFFNDQKLIIKKAELIEEDFRGLPGKICRISNDEIIVICGTDHKSNQALKILEISINDSIINPRIFFKKLWTKLD